MKNQRFKKPIKFNHRIEAGALEEIDYLAKRDNTTRGKLINEGIELVLKKYKK